jgi:hypothetical protein
VTKANEYGLDDQDSILDEVKLRETRSFWKNEDPAFVVYDKNRVENHSSNNSSICSLFIRCLRNVFTKP